MHGKFIHQIRCNKKLNAFDTHPINRLNAIYSHYDRTELNQFEHNIEVWRQVRDRLALHCSTVGTGVWFGLFVQLWHVLEHSTVIALVADARNPLFHVEPSLYHAVCHLMNKRMFVILNKVRTFSWVTELECEATSHAKCSVRRPIWFLKTV